MEPLLHDFALSAWGNPRAFLRQLPSHDFEYIDLSIHFQAFERLSGGILQHDKILVRAEYRAAVQALESDTDKYKRGAYVTGQPGIGKTYFLVYALVHLLGQRQPVAFQLLGGHPLYVLFSHTATLHSLDDHRSLDECGFVWALSDSNAKILDPPGVFSGSCVRVIQTTSPRAARWKEWSKQMGASCYIMDIWSDQEVRNLALLLECDVERMTTLAKKWGNIPRTLLRDMSREDSKIQYRYYQGADKAVRECSNLVTEAVELDVLISSPFYFIRPKTYDTGSIDREFSAITVPTQVLRSLLAEALQKQNNLIKLQFYNALSQPGQTCKGASRIYENLFHCFLVAGKEFECQWVESSLADDTVRLPTTLQQQQIQVIPSTNDALRHATPPYYWPASTNFPGIDSALVLEKEIFVFQVTISASHRPPIDGLWKLRGLLPSELTQVPWRVVFIGAEEDRIRMVAQAWSPILNFPTRGGRVPVAWSAVSPAQAGVTYGEYRGGADPAPESDVEA